MNAWFFVAQSADSPLLRSTFKVPFMFAQRENMFMMKLSQEGTQHARSMKVITIFTMIYLPPSLVAVSIFSNFSPLYSHVVLII